MCDEEPRTVSTPESLRAEKVLGIVYSSAWHIINIQNEC